MSEMKKTRKRLGLTQQVFADIIGSTQHRISEIENGYQGRSETKGQKRMMEFLEFIHDHALFDDLVSILKNNVNKK